MRRAAGYSLLELLFVMSLAATVGGIAVAQLAATTDAYRALAAARFLSARLQRARMEAVLRSADVAVRFDEEGSSYRVGVYVDGNRNGVRSVDVAAGVDRLLASFRLTDLFAGVDFGAAPGLPAVDAGGTAPGADPIRLGSANAVTFTPTGTSSSGSVYIRGRRDDQYVVRMFGETGKTRVLMFDRTTRQWRAL